MKVEGEVILEVNHVSMEFNLSEEKVDNIKEYVIRRIKNQLWYRQFYALQDVSFSMKKGETLALVGLNGSGKSTLLKVIAGVLKSTDGSASVRGKVAALIELGAGFDMDLTARENVWLSGAIMGYSRRQMKLFYDDIVEFSELGEFMEVPVKNFSSGMLARLAFSIATCRIPDILIVDEVLGVGDFLFQQKCAKRIEQIRKSGASILFVSHDMQQVLDICQKAIWLEYGKVRMQGECREVVECYQKEGRENE